MRKGEAVEKSTSNWLTTTRSRAGRFDFPLPVFSLTPGRQYVQNQQTVQAGVDRQGTKKGQGRKGTEEGGGQSRREREKTRRREDGGVRGRECSAEPTAMRGTSMHRWAHTHRMMEAERERDSCWGITFSLAFSLSFLIAKSYGQGSEPSFEREREGSARKEKKTTWPRAGQVRERGPWTGWGMGDDRPGGDDDVVCFFLFGGRGGWWLGQGLVCSAVSQRCAWGCWSL